MKVAHLGYLDSDLIPFIQEGGDEVWATDRPVSVELLTQNQIDFVVCYGYRHRIDKQVIDLLPGKIVNLHISLLPYNRGADPNFWSFVEGTPKGVTIHQIDEGLDTGDILVQAEVEFGEDETLKTSYEQLQQKIRELFYRHWVQIRAGEIPPRPQLGLATSHRSKDKRALAHLLTQGYDTPVVRLARAVPVEGETGDRPTGDS